jgi:hypothetical protein
LYRTLVITLVLPRQWTRKWKKLLFQYIFHNFNFLRRIICHFIPSEYSVLLVIYFHQSQHSEWTFRFYNYKKKWTIIILFCYCKFTGWSRFKYEYVFVKLFGNKIFFILFCKQYVGNSPKDGFWLDSWFNAVYKGLKFENRLCNMPHSAESWLPAMQHSAEFLQQQKISSTTPRYATQREIQVKIFWSTLRNAALSKVESSLCGIVRSCDSTLCGTAPSA